MQFWECGIGLSGLARGFLVAGAEQLIVSHWPVRDDAASFLSIKTIDRIQSNLDEAEALRQAMMKLRASTDIPNAAHPAIWASFA